MSPPLFERLTSLIRPPGSGPAMAGRGLFKMNSITLTFFEKQLRDSIVAFLLSKDKIHGTPLKGGHAFNQFWLQLPKVHSGIECLRNQLEEHTGSRDGPLAVKELVTHADFFGVSEESQALKRFCTHGPENHCVEVDSVGLVMVLLILHLDEPNHTAGLDPSVRLMLKCLEDAFSHFESARHGRIDRHEVADAMQQESAKAHVKEGKEGRTTNRLAAKLFDGLEWRHDDTLTFETFLRGVLKLVRDEFEEGAGEEDPELENLRAASTVISRTSLSSLSVSGKKSCMRKSENGGPSSPTKAQL